MIFGRSAPMEEFESAALPHMNDLYRTAARVIGNRSEAEDLVQETYLQAWKSFHRFEPGTNCRAWLFKILFHLIQHQRRKWYKSKVVQERSIITLPTNNSPLNRCPRDSGPSTRGWFRW